MLKVKSFLSICKQSFSLLKRSEPLVLSSSTAFFSTFALSPVMILLVTVFGIAFQSDTIHNRLIGKIASAVGSEAAGEIELIVDNFIGLETSWIFNLAGLLFLVFVATTLLTIVKQNIHKLWRIRKVSAGIKNQAKERLKLVSIIFITGLLFLISILIDSALAFSLDYLQTIIPQAGIMVIRFFNLVFALIVITVWFMVIFKMLPQARVDWEVAFNGGFITAILFYTGRSLLGKVLIHARIASIFGASASFALILLFIFYASFILYYGAAFTHEYGESIGKHICAGKNAHEYEERFLDSEV